MNLRSSGSLVLSKAIQGFISFKSAEGLSDRTVDSYDRLLQKWLEIERMVRQGWVERLDDPADRRVRHVHLTDLGRQLVDESIAARNEWFSRFGAKLTDEEKQQVARVFRLLAEKIEG
jgi:hypothetical protein